MYNQHPETNMQESQHPDNYDDEPAAKPKNHFLHNPTNANQTFTYADGTKAFRIERRKSIPLKDVPKAVVDSKEFGFAKAAGTIQIVTS